MRRKQMTVPLLAMLVVSLLIVMTPQLVQAATIHGDVYDLSLDRLTDVVVMVNTTPQQRIISQEGSYSFELPIGSYKITANQFRNNLTIAKTEELVQVIDDKDYIIDLFLYPNLEGEESLLNGTNGETQPEDLGDDLIILFGMLLVIVLAVGAILFLVLSLRKKEPKSAAPDKGSDMIPGKSSPEAEKAPDKRPSEEPAGPEPKGKTFDPGEDLKTVIEILKSEGGRTTQKEIRKHIPLSEAKVSLIITELEAKGYIEKIKKGRGNIIILKKKD